MLDILRNNLQTHPSDLFSFHKSSVKVIGVALALLCVAWVCYKYASTLRGRILQLNRSSTPLSVFPQSAPPSSHTEPNANTQTSSTPYLLSKIDKMEMKDSTSSAPIQFVSSKIKRIDLPSQKEKALDAICYPSFLNRLKTAYYDQATISMNRQQMWFLIVLKLFLNAYIDEGCNPRVTWKESQDYCYDSLPVKQRSGTVIYRHDCLNDQQHHVDALSFKRLLNALSYQEQEKLVLACRSSQDQGLTEKSYQCLTQLRTATFSIQGRYELQVLDVSSMDVKDLIHDKLQLLLRARLDRIDEDLAILLDSQFASEICEKLIIDLLSNAKIQEKQLLIHPNICLDFKDIALDCEHTDELNYISCCHVNDLNSKNILEDPYITDEPLTIARFLNKNPSDSIKKCPEFAMFRQWIEKHYYNPFCSQWMLQLQPKQEVIQVQPKRETSLGHVMLNDQFGDRYRNYINKQFKLKKNTWYSGMGNCFLASLFPEYEKNNKQEGNQKLQKIREWMSGNILENYHNYVSYVTVIPDFSKLDQFTQQKLKNAHWAIAQDESFDSKLQAIKTRANELLKSSTYLMEPEYQLAAQLLNRPIWVYNLTTNKIFLDENSKLLPYVIYGRECSGLPCYMLYKNIIEHYQALEPKQSK